MAVNKIKIKNGFFVEADGYVQVNNPLHVKINGWNCSIRPNGSIECLAIKKYADGRHSIRYFIEKNGFAKLTLKLPNQPPKIMVKGYVLPKGIKQFNGILGLSDGFIDERYAYYRDECLQNFMDEHGISFMKRQDPNQTFLVRNARYSEGRCSSVLFTDGNKKEFNCDDCESPYEDSVSNAYFSESTSIKVSGATWVLHKQIQYEPNHNNCFSTLYTLEKDFTKLVGIPNLRKLEKLQAVGRKGFLTFQELEQALKEIEPNLKNVQFKHIDFSTPKYFEVKGIDYYSWNLKTNVFENCIDFYDRNTAHATFTILQNKKFESPQEMEDFLHDRGFTKFAMSKYYATIHTYDGSNRITVDLTISTNLTISTIGYESYKVCHPNFWDTNQS